LYLRYIIKEINEKKKINRTQEIIERT